MSINKNLANPRSRIYSIGDMSVMNHDPGRLEEICRSLITVIMDVAICRFGWNIQTCIPHGHLHRMTYTRGRIDTTDSPDDEHLVARNM